MRSRALLLVLSFLVAAIAGIPAAQAQRLRDAPSIALKNGESWETPLYYVVNCHSMLKGTPEVEILEGPPGVTATVKEAMVLPRAQRCGNRVAGGMLVIAAKDIEDPSDSRLMLRVTYKTRDGDRKFTSDYNLSLIP